MLFKVITYKHRLFRRCIVLGGAILGAALDKTEYQVYRLASELLIV